MDNYAWQNLEPSSLRLSGIYANSFFQVPPNQREYRWTKKKELKSFWDDLVACVKEELSAEGKPALGHFLGTVVVINPESHSSPRERHKIIDGQ
jgi:uncharacterized protein with ParB-like and HNH nuclease domain